MSLVIYSANSSGSEEKKEEKVERVVEDALAYVDSYTEEDQGKVVALLEAQMKLFRPPNYLKGRPPIKVNFTSPTLNEEWKEVEKGAGRGPSLASRAGTEAWEAKARLPSPDDPSNPLQWKDAIDNAKTQLQYQEIYLENLELTQEFGANAWVSHNAHLSVVKGQLEQSLAALRREVDQVNAQRKDAQQAAAQRIETLENKWKELLVHNLRTEEACLAMEAQAQAQGHSLQPSL